WCKVRDKDFSFFVISDSTGWRYRLGVRTSDSQSGNPGSIPGTATKFTPSAEYYLTLRERLSSKRFRALWQLLTVGAPGNAEYSSGFETGGASSKENHRRG